MDLWSVAYHVPFAHENAQGYNVTNAQQVRPLTGSASPGTLASLDDAIELYLNAYRQQFSGKHGLHRKRQFLRRFYQHLADRGHSLQFEDITIEDGQRFIDELTNKFTGAPLGDDKRKRYKGALRSMSRFLFCSGAIGKDIFLELSV